MQCLLKGKEMLNTTDDLPLYKQIGQYFKRQIESGDLSKADWLPPLAVVAKKFKVNYRTARQAYEMLEGIGVVQIEGGKAKVVSDNSQRSEVHTGNIAFVSCNPTIGTAEGDEYATRIFCAVTETASYLGYNLHVVNLRTVSGLNRLLKGKWTGLIFSIPSLAHAEAIPFDDIADVPKVFTTPVRPGDISVQSDDFRGIELALDHLYELGHRKIAFLAGPLRDLAGQNRLEAYCRGMSKYGLKLEPEWLVQYPDYFLEKTEDQEMIYKRLFGGQSSPTAVICAGYYLTLGLMNALQRHQVSIPGDVSIVGYDDPKTARFLNPPLTTIHQPLERIGGIAVELLEKMIKGQKVESVVLPVELIVRASTTSVVK
jgi:DNA-binding LacI/PurR family transcriptional regulator